MCETTFLNHLLDTAFLMEIVHLLFFRCSEKAEDPCADQYLSERGFGYCGESCFGADLVLSERSNGYVDYGWVSFERVTALTRVYSHPN